MKEKTVEARFVRFVRAQGDEALKMSTQGSRGSTGWPDRLVVSRGGAVFWVEFKSPGGGDAERRLTSLQAKRVRWLRRRGHDVLVTSDADVAIEHYNNWVQTLEEV